MSKVSQRYVWLASCYGGLLALSLLFGLAFEKLSFLDTPDSWLYRVIFHSGHNRFLDLLAVPFNYNLFFHVPGLPEDMPTFFYFMIAGIALYFWFRQRSLFWWFLGTIVLGNVLVHLVSLADTHLVFRERPFIRFNETIDPAGYEAWKNLSSYPSGHARDIALYLTIFYLYLPQLKWFAILLTLFIMYSRIYQGAHYPSDVLGGAGIGVATAYLAYNALTTWREARARALAPVPGGPGVPR